MSPGDFTLLLREWSHGNHAALDSLAPIVYRELHHLAASHLRRERRDHTLQPTALIHEAYLALVDFKQDEWKSRAHFFAVASHIMRQVLLAHARKRNTGKRAGKWERVTFEEATTFGPGRDGALEALDDALNELERFDQRKVRVIEMRYFGGLTSEEISGVLGVSIPTVMRDHRMAEAWLLDYLQNA